MEIKELQAQAENIINRIDEKLGAKHDDELILMHLTEELGEISREIINPKLKREDKNKDNLGEEIADLIILTSKLANNNSIDIENAISNKMKKLKERHKLKWQS